ncbi:MAG: VWA domain-containing protein [Gemmatimonadota bacterium]
MRSFVIGLVLVGLALAPASALAQVNPYGSSGKGKIYGLDLTSLQGPESSPARIAIVMDFSGSMSGQSGSRTERSVTGRLERGLGGLIGGRAGAEVSDQLRERRQKAKEAIREVASGVDGLPDGTWFNVITFESQPHPWQPSLVEATEEIKDEAKDYFDDLEPTGGTAMIPALEEAFAEGPDYVVLVSDGEPNEGSQAVLDRVAELNADGAVVVHTIGIGEDHDRDFMETLAEQNGGEAHTRGAGIF